MVFKSSIPAKTAYNRKVKAGKAKRRFNKASAKTNTIVLRKELSQLKRKVYGEDVYLHTAQTESDKFKDIVSPCTQVRLLKLNDHRGILGTDTTDLTDDKYKLIKLTSHVHIGLENVNNEEETINFSVFLVSLKDIAGGIIDHATGFLTLTADKDYYSYSGWAFLNKERFTIHQYKHFTLTNYGTALTASGAQNKYGTNIDFDWKTPVNKMYLCNDPGEDADQGSPFEQIYQADPDQNYYILVFNDNSSVDTEYPAIKQLTIATWQKLA